MRTPRSPVFGAVARELLGPSLVVAATLIVKGYQDVGDGFAAGVVVALVLALHYVAFGTDGAEAVLPVLRRAPALLVGGLLLALGSGFFPVLSGGPPFSHWPPPGEHVPTVGALEVFTPLLFDVGVCLLVVGTLVVVVHQLGHADDIGADDGADDGAHDGDAGAAAARPGSAEPGRRR
ncbi:MnhB domain-containing protein [Quadrisphaera sp. DSM 44207]|uniref:MnhB domain-containing protein n=1 Tax=Quadrisphaera sp. DSM 44207 TaxID=1881057 RepID=UPI0008897316|nr:MnhB domain-containing protein [Quadrisphaera sp. DSM 44207]SDQ41535.1 multisubunit sodium/proton antiporter, MrpB subunit [Quadrisphaera sp. DSM 44207]